MYTSSKQNHLFFKQFSNRRKRMLFVSQCIKTLKVLPKCNSATNRQKLGLNFAVPFSRVCFQTMENISITQLQWCWNYVMLRVRLCLFACYWMHLPKFHSHTEKCTANVALRQQAFHRDFVVVLRCNREVGEYCKTLDENMLGTLFSVF